MDPIEVIQMCVLGAVVGNEKAQPDLLVPRLFTAAEFEALWKRNSTQVRKLLDELLCGEHADVGLEMLMNSGVIDALLPELRAIKNLSDDPASSLHKDVWDHSKQVVMSVAPVVELRWASLMHDVGKALTIKFDGRKVTFHNHDVVGAKLVDRIDRRLNLFCDDKALFSTVRTLVLSHLRPAGYKKTWTDSGVRRLLVDVGGLEGFERLMQLSRADLTTKNPNKRASARAKGDELEARVRAVIAEDAAPKLPKGTMGLIIERRVLPVGPALNLVRNGLEQMLRAGTLPTGNDAEWYATEGLRLLLAQGPVTGVHDRLIAV